ncbi:MAG: adaptor protein MecA [Lachnospiraceae bacterium]|nr:adaptor protein MecA [Lachnospiraceae bacterium]
MKFTRINDREIKCVLSEEELVSYGIDLDDILEKTDRIKPFFKDIMDMAAARLGIDKSEGIHIASAQISVLKDNSIAIVFHSSEIGEGLEKIPGAQSRIERIKSRITKALEAEEDPSHISAELRREILDMLEEQLMAEGNYSPEAMSQIRELREEVDNEELSGVSKHSGSGTDSFVIRFKSMDDAINYCSRYNLGYEVTSTLFKGRNDGQFYLFVMRGNLNSEYFQLLKLMSYEYGEPESDSMSRHTYIVDNSETLIFGNAFNALGGVDG